MNSNDVLLLIESIGYEFESSDPNNSVEYYDDTHPYNFDLPDNDLFIIKNDIILIEDRFFIKDLTKKFNSQSKITLDKLKELTS